MVRSATKGTPFLSVDETAIIDRLMYRIAHDLSASVRALVELPKWIAEDLDDAGVAIPPDVRENLDALNVNGTRLDTMINDLLEFSRVGRFQTIRTISVADLIEEITHALPVPPNLQIRVVTDVDEFSFSQPDFSRLCDALISNSVKHSDAETQAVEISLQISEDRLYFKVVDDGPGIPIAMFDKALELLTTLKSRDEVEGSGIGLAIAGKIAATNDGTLQLSQGRNGRGLEVSVEMALPPENSD